jgi:hypothetical protein
MRWWVQTRSEGADYRFLGRSGQPDRWWDRYLRFSAPEDRMIVVETDPSGWRLYVTAMDSGRKDGAAPPRAIRNSLLVHGGRNDGEIACGLIAAYLRETLGAELRSLLPRDEVERAIEGGALGEGVEQQVDALLARLSSQVKPQRRTGTWSASSSSLRAQESMAGAMMAAIRDGQNGVFGYLNLMSDAGEGDGLIRGRGGTVGVFLLDDGAAELTEYRRPEAATGGNPTGAGSARRAARPGNSERKPVVPWVLIGLIALGAIAVLVLIFGRNFTHGD